MLVTLNDILPAARREKRAVGAFNIGNYETLLAVVRAAERTGLPVIVQLYSRLADNGHAAPLGAAARALAERSAIPVVLHLDHGNTLEQVKIALDAGFSSVMLDASQLPFSENVALVQSAAALARNAGATIESEIGHVAFGDGAIALTAPDDAKRFYEATGVDALAVSIGTVHGFYKADPKLRIDLCAEIADSIPIPLVLHGGSGTPPAQVRAAIRNGIAKVNVATEFQFDYQQRLRARLDELGETFKPADLLESPVVETSTAFVEKTLKFFAGQED